MKPPFHLVQLFANTAASLKVYYDLTPLHIAASAEGQTFKIKMVRHRFIKPPMSCFQEAQDLDACKEAYFAKAYPIMPIAIAIVCIFLNKDFVYALWMSSIAYINLVLEGYGIIQKLQLTREALMKNEKIIEAAKAKLIETYNP